MKDAQLTRGASPQRFGHQLQRRQGRTAAVKGPPPFDTVVENEHALGYPRTRTAAHDRRVPALGAPQPQAVAVDGLLNQPGDILIGRERPIALPGPLSKLRLDRQPQRPLQPVDLLGQLPQPLLDTLQRSGGHDCRTRALGMTAGIERRRAGRNRSGIVTQRSIHRGGGGGRDKNRKLPLLNPCLYGYTLCITTFLVEVMSILPFPRSGQLASPPSGPIEVVLLPPTLVR
jgi:hypothetical protein